MEEFKDALEDLMRYYEWHAGNALSEEGQSFFDGVVNGLNKAWKLLDGDSIESLKA